MSGIYIPGIEMPTSCCECFAFKSNVSGQLFCKAKRIAFGKEDAEWLPKTTPNWCPLVPVPEHGRLIDADALLEHTENLHVDVLADWVYVKISTVEDAPTIIPADPVDKEVEG